ncbi:MAG: 23S rRNA (adenine(2503)-C(2))-methyltransferase RlmN [Desulfobacterales bacterium]
MMETSPKTDIRGLTRTALQEWLADKGEAGYRGDQIRRWLFQRMVTRFAEMTDLSRSLRALLADHFRIGALDIAEEAVSSDGSRKYLFRLQDGVMIESVLIPEKTHDTICISSQAGCAQGCRFCLTGSGGLERNLTAGEILGQVIEVRRTMDNPARLTNVVFMGMGEPLANYRPVAASIESMTDSASGLGFSARRITLSTVGRVPGMAALGRDTAVNLAVSLNAPDDEIRSRLMPVNHRYPLAALIEACRRYPLPPRRRITFEYILLDGVNDRPEQAIALAKLLRPIRAKINLIPFNEHEGCGFRRSSGTAIDAFQRILVDRHYTAVIRFSKGLDIKAACGQLRAKAVDAQRKPPPAR